MSTLKITKEYLSNHGAFQSDIHELVVVTMQTLSEDIPHHLRLSIVLSELITLTSHLRKSIKLYDGTLVPCNAISIALAGSGVSKDSSMNKVRRAFQSAYNLLHTKRKKIAREQAEDAALADGQSSEEWLNYYQSPPTLQVGLGTVEAVIKHCYDLERLPLGAASLQASEIGTELQSNKIIADIVKTIAIGYDLGKVPISLVKTEEKRVGEIKNLPVNVLFFGSEDAILYDNNLKDKFRTMFNTQLARRTIFSFSRQQEATDKFQSINNILTHHRTQRTNSANAQKDIEQYLMEMVEYTDNTPLTLTSEAQDLFDIYLEYNKALSSTITRQLPISKLARKHKQWLALKLSGTYAILDGDTQITAENYILAINTIELLANDLISFEKELIKETYEQFSDYCQYNIGNDENLYLSVHELRKLGYIPTTSSYQQKVVELIELASVYDPNGIYTLCNDGVCYEPIVNSSECGLSLLPFTKNANESGKQLKSRMATNCQSGYEFFESDFASLSNVLTQYAAYSPFLFTNGIRSKANLTGKTKWIVLDVDNSSITDEEAHFLLSDINHHIARTSDPSNAFKFRILLELDIQIDIPADNWRYFIESINEEIGINTDILSKAQIYFAYASDTVLSTIDATPLPAKEHIINASKHKRTERPDKLPKKQKEASLNDKRETFSYAYECSDGNGSRSLIKAALHAKDLGADKDYIIDLMYDINDYWSIPLDTQRLKNTIINQILRWES